VTLRAAYIAALAVGALLLGAHWFYPPAIPQILLAATVAAISYATRPKPFADYLKDRTTPRGRFEA
jgi:hypothetical protein